MSSSVVGGAEREVAVDDADVVRGMGMAAMEACSRIAMVKRNGNFMLSFCDDDSSFSGIRARKEEAGDSADIKEVLMQVFQVGTWVLHA